LEGIIQKTDEQQGKYLTIGGWFSSTAFMPLMDHSKKRQALVLLIRYYPR
jgi:hypothetical protein